MTDIKDGGPVFLPDIAPIVLPLRDWYAGMALQGLLCGAGHAQSRMTAAEVSYEFADAMLAARSKA